MKKSVMPTELEIAIARYDKMLQQGHLKEILNAQGRNKEVRIHKGREGSSKEGASQAEET